MKDVQIGDERSAPEPRVIRPAEPEKKPRAPRERIFLPLSPGLTEDVRQVAAKTRLPQAAIVAALAARAEAVIAVEGVAAIVGAQVQAMLNLSPPLLPPEQGSGIEDGVA